MTLFDAYIFVDWSASQRPGSRTRNDTIWIGVGIDGDDPYACHQRTRQECTQSLARLLARFVKERRRTLIGFDFPYGYPSGFADALGRPNAVKPWRFIWDELAAAIHDDERYGNNRFEVAEDFNRRVGDRPGPFWGHPRNSAHPHLPYRRRGNFEFPYFVSPQLQLEEFRLTERAIKEALNMRCRTGGIKSVWQLLHGVTVGGQALTGIPVVRALRCDISLRDHSAVWPFETGFTSSPSTESGPFILHAEIWPRVAERFRDETVEPKDKGQVLAMVRWARECDGRGQLAALFDRPSGLSDGEMTACVDEEGWILGGV